MRTHAYIHTMHTCIEAGRNSALNFIDGAGEIQSHVLEYVMIQLITTPMCACILYVYVCVHMRVCASCRIKNKSLHIYALHVNKYIHTYTHAYTCPAYCLSGPWKDLVQPQICVYEVLYAYLTIQDDGHL
jgi:hypothetical protein